DEFVLLSPSLWATNVSALRDKPRHIYAYDYLWALPWLYAHPDHEKAPMARAMFADPLAAALAKNPVLIVEESRLLRSMPQNADVLREFRKDPAVKKALAGYKRTAEIDACRPDFQAICKFGVWTPLKTRHDR
ncbi:MAG: hypothetical protein IT440_16245, partial [Phycisphaeraceae bacterium]|nr:hypothetical protein [Phycisphaeraceae bacterium]